MTVSFWSHISNMAYYSVKPWLHDASNASNVGHSHDMTDCAISVQIGNDEWHALNVHIGKLEHIRLSVSFSVPSERVLPMLEQMYLDIRDAATRCAKLQILKNPSTLHQKIPIFLLSVSFS